MITAIVTQGRIVDIQTIAAGISEVIALGTPDHHHPFRRRQLLPPGPAVMIYRLFVKGT